MFWWTHSKCQQEKTKTIKETTDISFSVTCHVYFCNRLSQNNQLDYEHMHSSIFLFNLWILRSKCIHKWNHVCSLVKTLLMQCHIHFMSHAENPISLLIHVFTDRKTKKSLFLIVWLLSMNSVFCVNWSGKILLALKQRTVNLMFGHRATVMFSRPHEESKGLYTPLRIIFLTHIYTS